MRRLATITRTRISKGTISIPCRAPRKRPFEHGFRDPVLQDLDRAAGNHPAAIAARYSYLRIRSEGPRSRATPSRVEVDVSARVFVIAGFPTLTSVAVKEYLCLRSRFQHTAPEGNILLTGVPRIPSQDRFGDRP